MLFDKLCKFVEQYGTQESCRMMDESKLFLFPYVAHEVLPHSKSQGETDELHLPFHTMAIEDEATCVLIRDVNPDNVGYGATRERMGLPEPTADHHSPRTHERRGHWRIFNDERFVNVEGQKKWIDPMWMGTSESVVGKHVYKVLLSR